MMDKIDKAIENLLGNIRTNIKADDAQKYSQAAQNLAHVKATYMEAEGKAPKKAAGA